MPNELKPEDVMKENDFLVRGVPQEQLAAEREQALREGYKALLREKDARIKELEEAQGAEFTCFVGEPHKVDHCPYVDELVKKDAEIERLTTLARLGNMRANDYRAMRDKAKTARAEAITEFAERLKQATYSVCSITGYRLWVVDIADIDQIAKEMTEET